MKGIFLSFLFVSTSFLQTQAQVFQVDTILYNGNPDKYINIVYLGDGYQASELQSFAGHVQAATDYLFTASPFDHYKNYFNVFAVRSISLESGAKHPRTGTDCPSEAQHPILATNNLFGSRFDVGSIHRLLYPSLISNLNRVITDNFPLVDQNLVLVNSPFYGGAGGTYATSSVHPSANEIVVHEIGHSFAQLADEYYAGDVYARELSNMTQQTNPNLVKWKNWLGFDNIGIYAYGNSGNPANWFRPHNNCKMRFLGPPFCAVCKEKLVQTILTKFGNPILSKLPAENAFTLQSDSVLFHVDVVQPETHTIRFSWVLNGDTLAVRNDSLLLTNANFLPGNNVLVAFALDTTAFIRADNHSQTFTYSARWSVTKTVTGTKVSSGRNNLKVYPSPTNDLLHVRVEGESINSEIKVFSLYGKELLSYFITENESQIDVQPLPAGVYLLQAVHNGQTFVQRFIKD